MSSTSPATEATEDGARLLDLVHGFEDEFVSFLSDLCRVESPTDVPDSQAGVHDLLRPALRDLGFEVRMLPGEGAGDHLLAVPEGHAEGAPAQLLVGHSDTVWPIGTLERMPVRSADGRLSGPGTLDMKGGLTMMVFALRALRELERRPTLAPVVFVNSDEETGSRDSRPHVRRLAGQARRALVLEPALGETGKIKTARKGVGGVRLRIRGRASHAGLAPEAGASAVLELARVVEKLHAMSDPARGTTVNVGTVRGGTRANVVAADAWAEVDLRVVTSAEGVALERRIRAITPTVPGVSIEIEGGMGVPPLERTPRNRALWGRALSAARELGMSLEEGLAGGGSDGNTTSLYTATLDGLGCVGDGAHADHEHIVIGATLDRCALLARLLMLPDEPDPGQPPPGGVR